MAKYEMPEQILLKYGDVLKHIEQGASLKDACDLELITVKSFRQDIKDNPELEELVKQCVASYKKDKLSLINDSKSWQAAAWILERRYREEYGKVDTKLIRIEELPKIADNIVNILIEELSGTDIPPEKVERIANRIQGIQELDPTEYEVIDLGKEIKKMTKKEVQLAEIEMKKEEYDATDNLVDKMKINNEMKRMEEGM